MHTTFSNITGILGTSKFYRKRKIGESWKESTLSLNLKTDVSAELNWSEPVVQKNIGTEIESKMSPAYRYSTGGNISGGDVGFTSNPWYPYESIPLNLRNPDFFNGVSK